MNYIKLIPSKLLNTLQNLVYPKGITLENCVIVSHIILYQFTKSYRQDKGMVEIPSILFGFALQQNNYKRILAFMESNKLILSTSTYKSGVACKGYCIEPNQYDLFGGIVEYIIQDKILNKKTQQAVDITNNRKNMKKSLKASPVAFGYIQQLKFDNIAALDWLKYIYENKIPYRGDLITIQTYMILEFRIKILKLGNQEPAKYRFCKRNETNGRIDTDITTLNTNFRRFIQGNYLHNMDCVSSQPGLILPLISFLENPLKFTGLLEHLRLIMESNVDVMKIKEMSNKIRYRKTETDKCLVELYKVKLPNSTEISKYKKLIESGSFYEYFMNWIANNRNEVISRSDMKTKTFLLLFGDGIKFNGKNSDFLKQEFPTINTFIQDIKNVFIESSKRQNNNKKEKLARMFPILMQAIESFIWIDTIIPKIEANNMLYYSIHDSVLVEGNNKEIVKKIIEDVYNNFGFNPVIKCSDNSIIEEFKNEKIGIKQGFEI